MSVSDINTVVQKWFRRRKKNEAFFVIPKFRQPPNDV